MPEIESVEDISLVTDDTTIEYLHNSIEERRCIGSIKMLSVYVYGKEGSNIPHFHIRKIGNKDACLKILTNEWFIHGKNDSILSRKEMKVLCEWLRKDDYANWKLVIAEWNKRCGGKVDSTIEMPDYTAIFACL